MGTEKKTNWIWTQLWTGEDKESPCLVLFRKELDIESEPVKASINISADTRYKLYINEMLVEVGPSKGDLQIWYFDSIDVSSYLKVGVNVVAVEVLRYPQELAGVGNHSTFRTRTPGLYLVGTATDIEGREYEFSTDETWKCKKEIGFKIVGESKWFSPLYIYEETTGNSDTFGWKKENYNDDTFENAREYSWLARSTSPGNLIERTIPFMYREKRKFSRTIDIKKSVYDIDKWDSFIQCGTKIVVPPNSEEIIEFDAGEEMTGYLKLVMSKGKGARIELLQAEAYVQDEISDFTNEPVKRDRLDFKNGHLNGFTDIYHIGGLGSDETPELYTPYWWRTFRFVQLKVVTSEEELQLKTFDYEETGYPLDVKTNVITSDNSQKDIWDISERSLRRCMHETYEDCPFYEQLQYAMDSRQQILYTYAVSADDRLARKCMDDFKRAQRYDGLINCCYPSYLPNIIPGFSIYYILMIYDHMMYFGDEELVVYHMPTIDGILNFFDRNITKEGYVDKVGVAIGKGAFWSFVDWAPEWQSTGGMPLAGNKGPITMESLLYILGLQYASRLALYLGKKEQSKEYLNRAKKVQQAILKYCVGENGMIQDGPGVNYFSQHCQVFAILTDTIDYDIGRKNLLETIRNKDKYAQSTVAMCFYLFRALEKAELYEYTNEYWDIWRRMIKNNCTTCVEAEAFARSECHAWGALALYELPSVVLGVRPAKPGYEKVEIKPVMGYLEYASGSVKTPRGMISVKWKKENGDIVLEYEVPENMKVVSQKGS